MSKDTGTKKPIRRHSFLFYALNKENRNAIMLGYKNTG